MAGAGGIRISADGQSAGAARELSVELAGRGFTVVLEDEDGPPSRPVIIRTTPVVDPPGPPPDRADVLVCFADAARSPGQSVARVAEAIEKGLASAAVVVSPEPLEEKLPDGVPVLSADPAWGPEVLARVAEAALALAREREARVRAEGRLGEIAQIQESFGAIASHDLRTPVTTLRLLRDLLVSQLAARADVAKDELASADELLGIMGRSLDKMDALIGDMLAAWRVSPGVFEAKPGPVDLNGVVEDIVAGLFPVAMQKDILLDLVTDAGAGLVLADERRVGQVVSNVLGNALKFTPRGGSVTVTTRSATSEEAGSEAGGRPARPRGAPVGAVLEVSDTGPGIAEADRDKVFRRFGRGKARATGGEPSTGLGLYICREIVEQYGGRIWYESEPGKGARFLVLFPGADASS